MSLRNPDAPRIAGPSPWPARATAVRSRPGARAAALVLAGLACVLLALWAVPPALDWGRFRTGIAAIAAAQLGRPVVISGEVTLRLLPEAVLTATGVMLPDQGDGVSASLSTLRLQVAVLPLLAGRITPRDLVLGAPVVQLPWPLPDGLARPARGQVPHAFAAHIENGILRVGRAQITGFNAGIHNGPEPATVPGLLPGANAAGFGAEGFAAFAGRNWRFTGALGVPDADGVSALDLAVSGQGAAARTSGTIQGTVSDGVVQGRLHAGGPDLSLLMPAAPIAWQADAPFVASGASVEAASVRLLLGGSPVEASLSLHVAAPVRLDGRVHAASLDLDSWVRVLGAGASAGSGAGPLVARLPGRIGITADTAKLLGGTVAGLHGTFVSDGESLVLDRAGGTLPGGAVLDVGGTITRNAGLLQIDGPTRLDAPDLRATLQWLHGPAPALFDALPAGVLRSAALSGILSAGPGVLSVSNLAGMLDDSGVTGGFGVGLGGRPRLRAGLVLEKLPLDAWVDAGWTKWGAMVRAGRAWSQFDGDIHLTAAEGNLRGMALHDLGLDAHTGTWGLKLDRAAATLSGARITVSGTAGLDGTLAAGTVRAVTDEAATLLGGVPPAWRLAPGLWHGPASMEATLAGPPDAVAVQLRTDIEDMVAEAELQADLGRGTASGSLTLRHPGAPRLLALLGISGAERWLDTGSVALRGKVAVQPGHVSLQDFDLVAADLRLGGSLDLDFGGTEPALRGAIDAGSLALPGWTDWRFGQAWLHGWSADLRLTAEQVTIGGVPAARAAKAALGLGSGIALLDLTQASLAGGQVAGQVAMDGDRATPLLAMHGQAAGLHIPGPLTGWPVDLVSGLVDGTIDADTTGEGVSLDRLTGTADMALHDARLSGLDVSAARIAAASHGTSSRQALLAALSHGSSDGLNGTARVDISHRMLHLLPTDLSTGDGAVVVQGTADQGGVAMRLDLASLAGVGVGQAGPWGAVRAVPDLGAAPAASRPKRKRR